MIKIKIIVLFLFLLFVENYPKVKKFSVNTKFNIYRSLMCLFFTLYSLENTTNNLFNGFIEPYDFKNKGIIDRESALIHWNSIGKYEGRLCNPSELFDWKFYVNYYSDLKNNQWIYQVYNQNVSVMHLYYNDKSLSIFRPNLISYYSFDGIDPSNNNLTPGLVYQFLNLNSPSVQFLPLIALLFTITDCP